MLHLLLAPFAMLFWALSVILYIMLLIKIFRHSGVGLGIIAICVPLFGIIWGWMKVTEFGIKKLMISLTLSIVMAALLAGVGVVAAVNSPEAKEAAKKISEGYQKGLEEAKRQQAAQQTR